MPVTLVRALENPDVASLRERRVRRGAMGDRGRRLRVELVNNMPDSAVMSTQRQFIKLLEEGAREFDVTLGLMTLSSVERSAEARRDMAALYRGAHLFSNQPPDAVIVTGAEPRAAELELEPYWRELTELFDSARANTYATLASCLAAHALVLHRDGLRRQRSTRKWSGLYPTEVVTPHPLLDDVIEGYGPHSRWNGLDERELAERGYVVLTRAGAAGVDMFAKDEEHLVLCFQGHPEYDGDTLAREFRRDVARAVQGAPAPHPPENYYDPQTEGRLRDHVAGMIAGVEAPHLPSYAMTGPRPDWRSRRARVVAHWLAAAAARKAASSGPTYLRARWGG